MLRDLNRRPAGGSPEEPEHNRQRFSTFQAETNCLNFVLFLKSNERGSFESSFGQ